MMDYEKLSKEMLIEALKSLQTIKDAADNPDEQKRLLHDLQVHEIELEMQNRELREAQQQLEASRDRYSDLYDFAPVGYCSLDPQGAIQEINLTAANMFNKERSRLIGRFFTDFIAAGEKTHFRQFLKKGFQTGKQERTEVSLRVKGRDPAQMQLLGVADGGCDESVRHCRITITDITRQKQMQDELERARRLETAGQVAGQIAHDFNNLLSPIVSYPALIREEIKQGKPVFELLDEMQSCARKIVEINQQLLALGRRGHFVQEIVDLNVLFQKIILEKHISNSVTVKTQFAPDLLSVKGGSAQLTRALINLLQNAEEAISSEGSITIKTENVYLEDPVPGYAAVELGEYVKTTVSDTGCGIRPEILERIFEPFFTTHRMDPRRGTGLGLSVVKGVVDDNNGYLTVESTPGKGTTFSLYIPITREEITIPASVMLAGGNERILIVDDDPVMRNVISRLLLHLGYKVNVVASGEQAVVFAKQRQYDLIILDMIMEGIDGAETYRRILEIHPGQKAIMLSGYAMTTRVQEALRLGAGTFVMKPVLPETLATEIRKELEKKPAQN